MSVRACYILKPSDQSKVNSNEIVFRQWSDFESWAQNNHEAQAIIKQSQYFKKLSFSGKTFSEVFYDVQIQKDHDKLKIIIRVKVDGILKELRCDSTQAQTIDTFDKKDKPGTPLPLHPQVARFGSNESPWTILDQLEITLENGQLPSSIRGKISAQQFDQANDYLAWLNFRGFTITEASISRGKITDGLMGNILEINTIRENGIGISEHKFIKPLDADLKTEIFSGSITEFNHELRGFVVGHSVMVRDQIQTLGIDNNTPIKWIKKTIGYENGQPITNTIHIIGNPLNPSHIFENGKLITDQVRKLNPHQEKLDFLVKFNDQRLSGKDEIAQAIGHLPPRIQEGELRGHTRTKAEQQIIHARINLEEICSQKFWDKLNQLCESTIRETLHKHEINIDHIQCVQTKNIDEERYAYGVKCTLSDGSYYYLEFQKIGIRGKIELFNGTGSPLLTKDFKKKYHWGEDGPLNEDQKFKHGYPANFLLSASKSIVKKDEPLHIHSPHQGLNFKEAAYVHSYKSTYKSSHNFWIKPQDLFDQLFEEDPVFYTDHRKKYKDNLIRYAKKSFARATKLSKDLPPKDQEEIKKHQDQIKPSIINKLNALAKLEADLKRKMLEGVPFHIGIGSRPLAGMKRIPTIFNDALGRNVKVNLFSKKVAGQVYLFSPDDYSFYTAGNLKDALAEFKSSHNFGIGYFKFKFPIDHPNRSSLSSGKLSHSNHKSSISTSRVTTPEITVTQGYEIETVAGFTPSDELFSTLDKLSIGLGLVSLVSLAGGASTANPMALSVSSITGVSSSALSFLSSARRVIKDLNANRVLPEEEVFLLISSLAGTMSIASLSAANRLNTLQTYGHAFGFISSVSDLGGLLVTINKLTANLDEDLPEDQRNKLLAILTLSSLQLALVGGFNYVGMRGMLRTRNSIPSINPGRTSGSSSHSIPDQSLSHYHSQFEQLPTSQNNLSNQGSRHGGNSSARIDTRTSSAAGFSHNGLRRKHQDSIQVSHDGNIVIIADGMDKLGDKASRKLVKEIDDHLSSNSSLQKAADEAIVKTVKDFKKPKRTDPSKPPPLHGGTTLVGMKLKGRKAEFVGTGDSRIKIIRENSDGTVSIIEPIPNDNVGYQNTLNEWQKSHPNHISSTNDDFHIATQSNPKSNETDGLIHSSEPPPKVRHAQLTLKPGDKVIMGSDGMDILLPSELITLSRASNNMDEFSRNAFARIRYKQDKFAEVFDNLRKREATDIERTSIPGETGRFMDKKGRVFDSMDPDKKPIDFYGSDDNVTLFGREVD